MSESLSTFERLVLTLNSAERMDMYRKLAEAAEADSPAPEPIDRAVEEGGVSVEARLQAEPLLVRIWIAIRAFFTSSSPIRVYSESLVAQLGRNLAHTHGSYINVRQATLTEAFLSEARSLRACQDFFRASVASSENDRGGFYLVLGSLLMPATHRRVQEETDPFTLPMAQEQKVDARLSFLRKMDVILSAVPDEERSRMYQAARALLWLSVFCSLPIDRLTLRFGQGGERESTCPIDLVSEELRSLARALDSARRIPVALLESLFLVSSQDRLGDEGFDLDRECATFVSSASAHLSRVREFRANVPVTSLARLAMRDVGWVPEAIEGSEDWFLLYKGSCRRRFDERWSAWTGEHRKALLHRNILLFLDADSLMELASRPWEGLWLSLSVRRELSLRFLKHLFSGTYQTAIAKTLKILLIEGDFLRRENLMEYTDAFSALERADQDLSRFEERLSPKGDLGEGFEIVRRERMATVKGKARLDNLMLSIDAEVEQIASRIAGAFRSVESVLGGILAPVRAGPYDTLANLASIQGKHNDRFRRDLANVRELVATAFALLSEAEIVEKEGK